MRISSITRDHSKWSIRCIDCAQPCAAKACSIFASSELERPENPKPSSSINNYRTVLSRVDGWEDLSQCAVVGGG